MKNTIIKSTTPAADVMTITLKDGYISTSQTTKEYKEFVTANKGKTLEVNTQCLWDNQYNIKDTNFTIFDVNITAVNNDKRTNVNYCGYCGKRWNRVDSVKPCLCDDKYTRAIDDKKTNIFANENAAEILNSVYDLEQLKPELEQIKGIKLDTRGHASILIGSYELHAYTDLNYYRLRNNRKCINFVYDAANNLYYINNGIGYKQTNVLDIPATAQRKLNTVMTAIFAAANKGGVKND